MGIILIHHSKKGQQITLDQQLTSTDYKTQAITVANNIGHFAQAFWVQVFC
jgi:hypothetical protein